MLAHAPATTRRVATLTALAFALTAGILSAPTSASSWADAAFSSTSEQELIAWTNQSREEAGEKPLNVDAELTAIARWRSKDMSLRGYFSHSIPPVGGRVFDVISDEDYCYTLAGENIGWNTHSDGVATARIHEAFLESPGHRVNVLSERWNVVGVGAYKGTDGRNLWTVLFADSCQVARLSPRP